MGQFDQEINSLKYQLHPIYKHKPASLVFYGSSSLRLWENFADDLSLKGHVANAAFGGSTIPECYHYFKELILPLQPQAIFFYCGDNDIGNGASTEETIAHYKKFYAMVRSYLPDIVFISLSVKPSPIRNELIPQFKQLNSDIVTFISQQKKSYFISVFNEMLNEKGHSLESLFIEDGLHMNRKGYKLWSDLITPKLNAILKKEQLL